MQFKFRLTEPLVKKQHKQGPGLPSGQPNLKWIMWNGMEPLSGFKCHVSLLAESTITFCYIGHPPGAQEESGSLPLSLMEDTDGKKKTGSNSYIYSMRTQVPIKTAQVLTLIYSLKTQVAKTSQVPTLIYYTEK